MYLFGNIVGREGSSKVCKTRIDVRRLFDFTVVTTDPVPSILP